MSGMEPTLPRASYLSPEAFDQERERIFWREWFVVGRVEELAGPGDYVVKDVAGESILVVRTRAGALSAYYNVCRHRGSQLVPALPGAGPTCAAVGALRCPYHSWTYSLAGELIRSPHAEDVDPTDFSLHPVGVVEWAGFAFVHLTPGVAAPVDGVLAKATATLAHYAMGDLVTGRTMTYEVAANYKVVAENYNECYHCGPVHPELTRLVPAFGGGGAGLAWEDGIPHRPGAWTFTTTGTTTRAPLPGLSEAERTRHKGELVHPNLLLSCSADHVAAFVLLPQDVDRTRIDCHLLFAADAVADPAFDPSDAADLWDLVNRQDWAICESVQRGMSSRAYTHGWFAPMEDDSADIRRWLLPRLAEPPQGDDG